jgi:hypothetical protein
MARTKPQWRPFLQAREWAHSLRLQSEKYWRIYRKGGLPSDIPSNPNREYLDEWQGWGDWLGTGRVADKDKIYRTYEEASAWAKEQGITKLQEWRAKTKDKSFPKDIPVVPHNTYKKQWTNWGDFLQTGYVHYKQRTRVSYQDAKAWARKMGVLRKEDWDMLSTNGLMPPEIPTNVSKFYEEWKSWSDFLGNQIKGGASITEVIIGNEISQFLCVDDSIRSIRLKDGKSKRVDIAIPNIKLLIEYDGAHWHKCLVEKDTLDNEKLKEVGWTVLRVREKPLRAISDLDVLVSAKDSLFIKTSKVLNKLIELDFLKPTTKIKKYIESGLLSKESVGLQDQNWLSYLDAKNWAKQQGIKSESQWRKFKAGGVLPSNIPATPEEAYRTEWIGWGDFLGTGNIASRKELMPFPQAREYIRKLGIKDSRDWRAKIKEGIIPANIARNPQSAYGEWVSWLDWLGTENTAKRKRSWLPFSDAVEISKSLGLRSESDWRKAKKEGRIPNELPSAPEQLYKIEWKGWGYWLGTGNKKRGT